jgi:hypothetical protein
VHTHATGGRRRGKSRSRILYWFRTPPGVRIGRSALDEDAIRLIEEHNPDVEFDWTRILKMQDAPVEARAPQAERRNRPRPRDDQPREAAPRPVPNPPEAPPIPDSVDTEMATDVASQMLPEPQVEPPDSSESPEADIVEQFLAEPRVEVTATRSQPGDAISAVESRLGSEGLYRLRARYSEVMARISETVSDPARQEELKSQAERLNPDTWVTDAEVKAGLESYESVFESLRVVVGRRRRRRRRSSGRQPAGDSQEMSTGIIEPAPEHEPGGDADEMDGLGPTEEQ